MERILYGIGYMVGQIIVLLFTGIFSLIAYFFRSLKTDPEVFLPLQLRYEHTHIVAGSGHGKTQLLQHLIVTHDLPAVIAGERSLVVIDSQGDMLEKLLRLSELSPRFGALSERLMYINPQDIQNPPCLNLFDFGLDRLSRYDLLEREKLINGTISLYEYLFGALLGAELTARQGVIFRYLARLLMVVPGATIFTLMDFMEDPERVRSYLSQLDGPAGNSFSGLRCRKPPRKPVNRVFPVSGSLKGGQTGTPTPGASPWAGRLT